MQMKDLIGDAIIKESEDITTRYETMLENVNYHLNEATKKFG